jgi:thioredoxin 1
MIDNKIILVMFFSERCGFCKSQNSILEELRNSMGDKIEIIKIDIDKERDKIKELNIDATPTLFILKNDNMFQKYVGLTYRNELELVINDALK